jgi:hypothetical protein
MMAGAGAASVTADSGGLNRPAPLPGAQPQVAGAVTKVASSNWSGYAQTDADGTYTDVVDTWTVPTVTTTAKGEQYSSDWVGVGGYSEDTLVQAGTEADSLDHTAQYDAWTEILPDSEVVIPGLTINPGDQITTTIQEIKAGTWAMTVKDDTTGQSGGRTVSYASSGASAEAIHERPEVGSGLATLAKGSPVTFVPGDYSTTKPGKTAVLHPLLRPAANGAVNEILMVNNADSVIATPSKPSTAGDGFTVADGKTAPAPPAG